MLWEILTWALLGLVAGAIAKKVMPGKDPGGFVVTMLIGIAGAVVGGFIANFIGLRSASGFNIYSIFVAVGGALVVLWGYRQLKK